jgi:HEAT repeat protein
MNSKTCSSVLATASIVVCSVAVAEPSRRAQHASPTQLRERISHIDGDLADKVQACQQLAELPAAEAVPVLLSLLSSEALGSHAVTALVAVRDPAADPLLRRQIPERRGAELALLIEVIGRRHDTRAVEMLAERLNDNDASIVKAAALALAEIASDEAGAELVRAFRLGVSPKVYVLADAYLHYAKRLATRDKQRALEVYASVADAYLPDQFRLAALRGKLLLLGEEATDLLLSLMASNEEAEFQLTLAVLPELHGDDLRRRVRVFSEKLPPERRVKLLGALDTPPATE